MALYRNRNPLTEEDSAALYKGMMSERHSGPWLSRRMFSGFSDYEAFKYVRDLYSLVLQHYRLRPVKYFQKFFVEVERFLRVGGPRANALKMQRRAKELLSKLSQLIVDRPYKPGKSHYRRTTQLPIEDQYGKTTAILVDVVGNLLMKFSGTYSAPAQEGPKDEIPYMQKIYGPLGRTFITFWIRNYTSWLEIFWYSNMNLNLALDKMIGIQGRKYAVYQLIDQHFDVHQGPPPPGALPPREFYGPKR